MTVMRHYQWRNEIWIADKKNDEKSDLRSRTVNLLFREKMTNGANILCRAHAYLDERQ